MIHNIEDFMKDPRFRVPKIDQHSFLKEMYLKRVYE